MIWKWALAPTFAIVWLVGHPFAIVALAAVAAAGVIGAVRG